MHTYDAILIGTGQAAYTLVSGLLALGQTVAVIEGDDRFGGTCANYGCTPTKALVASARAMWGAREAARWGVSVGEVTLDFAAVMARMNGIRGAEGLGHYLMEHTAVYHGFAQFEDANTVRIGSDVIRGQRIYIHVGTRPRRPTIAGAESVTILDNRSLLELTALPEHLIVLGGSYIGMEYAQIFRRFGSAVTVIEPSPTLMSREDADISQILRDLMEGEGVTILCGAVPQSVAPVVGGGVALTVDRGGEILTISGSHLVSAIGRLPNSDTLNLAAAGVIADARGFITVNEHLQTNIPHIYALGDVNGRGAFTHTSVNDGEIVLDNLKGGDRRVSDRIMTYSLFTDPPLARVGIGEREARQSGKRVLMGTRPMSKIGRAREKGETVGMVKLLVDADTDLFLGATVFGVGGDEVVNMITVCMTAGITAKQFRKTVLIHPTVAELIPWVLDDLQPLT